MTRARLMLLMALSCACGPLQSQALIADADSQLEAATQAGAKKLAPYEYETATRYLHQAREEVGISQFVAASEHAERAKDEAATAHRLALERSRAP